MVCCFCTCSQSQLYVPCPVKSHGCADPSRLEPFTFSIEHSIKFYVFRFYYSYFKLLQLGSGTFEKVQLQVLLHLIIQWQILCQMLARVIFLCEQIIMTYFLGQLLLSSLFQHPAFLINLMDCLCQTSCFQRFLKVFISYFTYYHYLFLSLLTTRARPEPLPSSTAIQLYLPL